MFVSTPTERVQEYLYGLPPPSLKDLEAKYGPAAVKGKKGVKSWRSGNGNSKEGNKKKKNWCIRKPLYDIIDKCIDEEGFAEGFDAAVKEIEELVKEKVGPKLVNGATSSNPGSTGMQLLFSAMAKEKIGAAKRSAVAKLNAETRKKNRIEAPFL